MKKILAFALVLASGAALAQQAGSFVCGGVGDADQQRMKADAHNHALMATFATASGAYLADIDVQVRRGSSVVLQGHCNGPIMLMDLAPAGKYEVTATSQGRSEKKTVAIGGKPASVTFTWPGG